MYTNLKCGMRKAKPRVLKIFYYSRRDYFLINIVNKFKFILIYFNGSV